MAELDDNELLAEFARTESEGAFATLVSRHVNLVYSAALRFTNNSHHAEEITQAVFIILARKASSLGRKVVLSGWLYQTARFTSANFLKNEIRRQRREQEAYMQSTLNEPASESWEQISPWLDEAMGKLGETDRNAIVLRFFENKSAREVALALQLNEPAAHKRVSRALEKLRKIFLKRGVVSTSAVIAGLVSANSVQAAPSVLAATTSAAAVAKGAAAGGSTLTLIKGTLKIMAWTKSKTAVVAGAIFLLTSGTAWLGVKVLRAANPPNLVGAWEGIVNLGGEGVLAGEVQQSRIVLKISKTNGVYAAIADLIDVGKGNFSLGKLNYHYPNVHGEVDLGVKNYYDATVNFSGSEISGTLKLGNASHPLALKRTTQPSALPASLAKSEYAPRADDDLQGFWTGKLGNLHLNWKIARQSDGSYRAELDNPDQNASGQPVRVTSGQPDVELRVMSGSGMFEGKLNGAQLAGNWVQGGRRTPVTFSRIDPPIYNPIPDNEPQITERVRNLKTQELRPEECTPAYWRELQRTKNPEWEKGLAAALGNLQTVTLVERTEHDGRQSYRYRMAYEKMTILLHVEFENGKVALVNGTSE